MRRGKLSSGSYPSLESGSEGRLGKSEFRTVTANVIVLLVSIRSGLIFHMAIRRDISEVGSRLHTGD